MQRFADWHEPGLNRPWVAVVNRAFRRATLGHWAKFIGFLAFLVILGLTSKHSGSLFADDVPRWASRVNIGLYFCFTLFGFRKLTQRRFQEGRPLAPTEDEPVVWLEIKNKWSMTKFDWGHLMLQSGCLSFKGEHTQFQLNLADIHSTTKEEYGNPILTVWIPTTGQRLKIANNSQLNDAWLHLLTRLSLQETSNLLSTFPPKSDKTTLRGFLWILGCMLVGELLILLTWSLAKNFSGYESLSLAILFPTTLSLFAWLALLVNLRLWSRKRQLKNQMAL